MNKELYAQKIWDILKVFPEGDPKNTRSLGSDIKIYFKYRNLIKTVSGIGVFSKHWLYVAIAKRYKFCYSFCPEGGKALIYSVNMGKRISNRICERVLPFLASRGKDKSTILLIINNFPEYASFALNFMQEANRE